MASATMTVYDRSYYPYTEEVKGNKVYDYGSGPERVERNYSAVPAVSADFRYKWLLRTNVEMYSGLGIGVSFVFPVPYLYSGGELLAPHHFRDGGNRCQDRKRQREPGPVAEKPGCHPMKYRINDVGGISLSDTGMK